MPAWTLSDRRFVPTDVSSACPPPPFTPDTKLFLDRETQFSQAISDFRFAGDLDLDSSVCAEADRKGRSASNISASANEKALIGFVARRLVRFGTEHPGKATRSRPIASADFASLPNVGRDGSRKKRWRRTPLCTCAARSPRSRAIYGLGFRQFVPR